MFTLAHVICWASAWVNYQCLGLCCSFLGLPSKEALCTHRYKALCWLEWPWQATLCAPVKICLLHNVTGPPCLVSTMMRVSEKDLSQFQVEIPEIEPGTVHIQSICFAILSFRNKARYYSCQFTPHYHGSELAPNVASITVILFGRFLLMNTEFEHGVLLPCRQLQLTWRGDKETIWC